LCLCRRAPNFGPIEPCSSLELVPLIPMAPRGLPMRSARHDANAVPQGAK
jgi:hypothetical protein